MKYFENSFLALSEGKLSITLIPFIMTGLDVRFKFLVS